MTHADDTFSTVHRMARPARWTIRSQAHCQVPGLMELPTPPEQDARDGPAPVAGLVLDRWDGPDLPMEPAEVEPVDVLGDRDLEVVDVLPRGNRRVDLRLRRTGVTRCVRSSSWRTLRQASPVESSTTRRSRRANRPGGRTGRDDRRAAGHPAVPIHRVRVSGGGIEVALPAGWWVKRYSTSRNDCAMLQIGYSCRMVPVMWRNADVSALMAAAHRPSPHDGISAPVVAGGFGGRPWHPSTSRHPATLPDAISRVRAHTTRRNRAVDARGRRPSHE